MVKIAIIYYSMYGHIAKNAQEILAGIKEAGGDADVFQISETLPGEVLTKMHAAPKDSSIPEIKASQLPDYDAFLFGIPTRYGNFPAQWKTFWDQTGGLWASGALHGKPFGIFFSTGTPGGGQEATAMNALSSFVHHGMIFVPLGYGEAFPLLTNLDEVHGSSPWGSGTFAGADGSRSTTELEKKIHHIQGKSFYKVASKLA
ncbi:protoplast secreted protein 2 [[Candida] jaroonii]|uniref:Protoplast secreted protein 2 n=1 Tax=[Candida] jaroonii TaxID=467808 RepID=A0ACA9Y536_9ASCO|nr:protoplast secreted protein 2 [[Candida] jaroonii]